MPIVNYFEVAADFELAPAEAMAFFNAKGLKATFDWRDQLGDEHDLAFTVAKMMDLDLLHTVKGRLDSALANGDSLQDFKKQLIPELQAAGWWGKKDVIDPLTGQVKTAQLGSASRLDTIFRTNLQGAYSVGRWQAIEAQAEDAPYLMYDAVDDHRTRPEHAALDGLVLKVDDPYWHTHAPSNGWNCRCGVIQLDDDQLQDHGLREGTAPRVKTRKWLNPRTGNVHKVPTDLDPGWDHNPGKTRYEQLKVLAAEKALARYEAKEAAKLAEAQAKIDASVANYQAKLAKLQADAPALKGKLAAQAQKLAQAELDYHLENKTPYLAQAIKTLQKSKAGKSKAGQAMTPEELLATAQEKALVIEQSAHLSAFKAKSIAGKPISVKQQAVFDALPAEAQASILADIDAKTGVAAAKADLQKIADYDADKYASTKADLLGDVPNWQNHPDPKALLAQIEAEGNLEGSAGAWLFQHETEGTAYLAQAIKQLKATQAGKAMKASELAEAAKTKAAKLEQSAHLSSYKAKSIAGKAPSDKAKAAFQALPEEAQASITDDIQAKLAAKAEAAAKQAENAAALDELALITQGQAPELPGIQKSVLAKIEADPELAAKYPEPVDLLQAVQAQAVAQQAKVTQGTLKSGYKKKALAGHIPTPKQKAMFEALTDEEQAELLAEIDAAKAAQAKAAEKAKIQAAMDDASKAAEQDQLDPSTFGALVDELQGNAGAQAKLQANVDELLDGHKHTASLGSLIDKLTYETPGNPTPKQTAKYLALDDGDQAKIDALIIAKGFMSELTIFKKGLPKTPDKQPDKAPEPAADPLPALDDLTQIGGQGGSNPGGLYQDTKTGIKWYIKRPANPDQARNEVLTGRLYAAAGVEVPEMHWRNDPQGTQIYSKIVDGMDQDAAGLKAGQIKGVTDNFAVDAWLANWDVIGLGFDNLLVKQGRAIRIDTGAGLLYRAQGTAKGGNWNDQVGEIDSLLDADLNPQAAAVFKHATDADLIAGVRKVLSVDAKTIKALVDQYGPGDATTKADLLKTLKARQKTLAKRYPEAVKKPKTVPLPATERVSKQEFTDVLESRINGVALATDKDQIEDQSVLLWSKRNTAGEPVTAGMFKVRGKTQTQLGTELGEVAAVKVDYNGVHKKVIDAIISIRHRIKEGQAQLEGSGYAKAVAARDFYQVVLDGMKQEVADGLRPEGELDALVTKLGPIMSDIEASVAQKKPIWNQTGPDYAAWHIAEAKPALIKPGKRKWTRAQTFTYQRNASDRSFHRESDTQETIPTLVFTTEVGDATVRFFPDHPDVKAALRGRVQIEAPGESTVSAARIFQVMDELGIDSSRAGQRDQERLYLSQLGYANKLDKQAAWKKAVEADDLDKQKALIEKKTGVSLASNPHYRPDGEHQAFNHGRRTRYRPELLGSPEWAGFEKNFRVVHDFTSHGHDPFENLKVIMNGGGQMAPTADKLRRGVPIGGMSPGADMKTGGASYFFTRLRRVSSTSSHHVVWKARVAARVDAISYNGDKFGRVFDEVPGAPVGPEYKQDWVQSNRAVDLKGMEQHSDGNSQNEVIVKDSLSLFDDLDHINAKSPTQRREIIKWLQEQGYKEWPGGRPLKDVIRYQGQV